MKKNPRTTSISHDTHHHLIMVFSEQQECSFLFDLQEFEQVLLESGKDVDVSGHSMPNLVYVSREKSSSSPHHFKAGALNALVRFPNKVEDVPNLAVNVRYCLDCSFLRKKKYLCFL